MIFRNFFSEFLKKKVTQVFTVYELILRKAINAQNSPGHLRRRRKIVDTSTCYVRGEDEFLKANNWRPKGDSLLIEHQWILERNVRICLTEKIKHILAVQDQLEQKYRTKISLPGGIAIKKCSSCGKLSEKLNELEVVDICSCLSTTNNQLNKSGRMPTSFSRSNLAALAAETYQILSTPLPTSSSYSNLCSLNNQIDESVYEPWKMTKKEQCICSKCIELIRLRIPSKPYIQVANKTSDDSQCNSNSSSPDLLSPDQNPYNQLDQVGKKLQQHPKFNSSNDFGELTNFGNFNSLRLGLIPELEESRLSKVVSKQGLLYHLELIADKSTFARKYVRRFVVVKRPYLFLYTNDNKTDELGVINLTNTELIVNEITKDPDAKSIPKVVGIETNEIEDSLQISKTFILKSMISCNIFQCFNNDVCEWLYAINPLFAGQIKSKQARRIKRDNKTS